jgi:hypothetical protein
MKLEPLQRGLEMDAEDNPKDGYDALQNGRYEFHPLDRD